MLPDGGGGGGGGGGGSGSSSSSGGGGGGGSSSSTQAFYKKRYHRKNEAVKLKPAVTGVTNMIVFININFLRKCSVLFNAVYHQFLLNFKIAESIKILIAAFT